MSTVVGRPSTNQVHELAVVDDNADDDDEKRVKIYDAYAAAAAVLSFHQIVLSFFDTPTRPEDNDSSGTAASVYYFMRGPISIHRKVEASSSVGCVVEV